jgi:hypothetical protein
MAGRTDRFPLIRTGVQRPTLPTSLAVDHESTHPPHGPSSLQGHFLLSKPVLFDPLYVPPGVCKAQRAMRTASSEL